VGKVAEKAVILWSGGKDAALALHEARQGYEIAALLTTVAPDGRIAMHGVRGELLHAQAEALGLPLHTIPIPFPCPNAEYERAFYAALAPYRAAGVRCVICGDLFLEDVRRYREERLFGNGLIGVYPLWQKDTAELAQRFLKLGFRAVLCCVDSRALDPAFAGRFFDDGLLAELPANVDPCGENGEFHTFVFDGPIFRRPVAFKTGESTLRDGRFAYCHLLPIGDHALTWDRFPNLPHV
jgi:uncharacterized protein (TIGR00290 family)